ncbi:hypothetical protein FDB64_05330 [Clostridium botulinum]|nr:hypothetical protein [Clostridium botulinum]NFM04086.1 hypothetical protein [Clostridium botulinum]
MKEINIAETEIIINKNTCAFLCGNGFSMNFDENFCNIFDRLYNAHKNLLHNSSYNVYSKVNARFKHKCIDNYRNVLSYVRGFSEKQLYKIFDDGLIFAQSIIENKELINYFKENHLIIELTFGRSELDLIEEICLAKKKEAVNIEYWSILIYFYFLIEFIDSNCYKFPDDNLFISIIRIGNINKDSIIDISDLKSKILNSVQYNGFNTYYRLLFCIAIFSEGKHLNINNLSKVTNLNMDKIQQFLKKFNSIITLNYDNLLEQILPTKYVYHLHGSFVLNKKEYVYSQSLGLTYNKNEYVSFSDILIGDYFYNKINRAIINNLSQNEIFNKKELHHSKILNYLIKENNINTIIIFGLNIENDQHILRTVMTTFAFNKISNPKIIYCYFLEEEKLKFNKTFYDVITFNDELSKYVRNIEVIYVKTKEILNEYFLK